MNKSLHKMSEFKPNFICNLFSLHFAFPYELLAKYQDILNWELLSINEKLNLTFDEFVQFADKWDFGYGTEDYPVEINYNPALPWSLKLLKTFENRWQWESISQNQHIPWDRNIIREFKDKLYFEHLSDLRTIEWTKELLNDYHDRWNWAALAKNSNVMGNKELINTFPKLKEALKDQKNRKSTDDSVFFPVNNIPEFYSETYLEENKDILDWEYVSAFGKFELTEHVLAKFSDYFIWKGRVPQEDGSFLIQPSLSMNSEISWNNAIIDLHIQDIGWHEFSHNTSLPWSIAFIERYWEKWNHNNLIFNNSLYEKVFRPYLNHNSISALLDEIQRKDLR